MEQRPRKNRRSTALKRSHGAIAVELPATPDTRQTVSPNVGSHGGGQATVELDHRRSLPELSFHGLFKRVKSFCCELCQQHGLDIPPALKGDLFNELCIGGDDFSQTVSLDKSQYSAIPSANDVQMSNVQQQFLVQSYWTSLHCLFPILEQQSFREHQSFRHDTSPVVLAVHSLCLQLSSNSSPNPLLENAALGWSTFTACQNLLSQSCMQPSLLTLQTLSLAVVFLLRSGRTYAARASLASALDMAELLRLTLPLVDNDPNKVQLSRTYIVLFTLDTLIALRIGCCHMTTDDTYEEWVKGAAEHVEDEPPLTSAREAEKADWLQYHIQAARLMTIFRTARRRCLDDAGSMVIPEDDRSIAARVLEEKAKSFNREAMRSFVTYRDAVPSYLKTARTDGAPPLSIYQAPLRLDFYSPSWLHRQRIWLELQYHEIKMGLWLGFMRFPPTAEMSRPLVESHQCACLHHAMANAFILEQAMKQLSLVEAPEELVQQLFRAALVLLAFLLAQPTSTLASSALKSLSKVKSLTSELAQYTHRAEKLGEWISAVDTIAKTQMTALRPPKNGNTDLTPQVHDDHRPGATWPTEQEGKDGNFTDKDFYDFLAVDGVSPSDDMWNGFSEPYPILNGDITGS